MTDLVKRQDTTLRVNDPSFGRAPGPDPVDPMLAIQRLIAGAWRRKRTVAAVFLIVVVPATIATLLATPLYRSTALVQVNADSVQVLPYRDVAETGGGGGNFENYMGTQDQILRGAGLRIRVADRIKAEMADTPAIDEIPYLADRYELKKIEKSQIFELSYQAPSPQVAATIVNLFAEEYIKHNFEMRQETRLKAEAELQKEMDALKERLQLSEKDLMAYAKQYDIVSLEQGQVDPLQDRLAFFNTQVSQNENEVAQARVNLESLQKASVNEFPQRLISEQIRTLETDLLSLEQELATLRITFGEKWPAVIEKTNEVTLVKEQLAREKAAALASHREQALIDLRAAEARHNLSLQALNEQKGLVNRFHDASIEYNILRREVDTNRNLYEGLLERLRQTGVLTGFQFGNVQVVEPGRPNYQVYSPKIIWNLGIAALLGLTLGIAVVIGLEAWNTTISSPDEVEQLAMMPALGSLPLIASGAQASGKLLRLPWRKQSAPARELPGQVGEPPLPFEVTESIRSICASLLLSRSDATPRVLVVTSASPAEGKTTVVRHLGRAFADAGARTLLVEADLRKPDLSHAFAVGNESGLSLYLAGHVSPWPKIHETDVPNLHIAAGGPVPPNPAALLHSDRLGQFLQAATEQYQMVLIDSPPLLAMADARILGSQADGVVLVVRAGSTAVNLVRRARRLLDAAGANVLGLVLNAWVPNASELTEYGHYHPVRLESQVN